MKTKMYLAQQADFESEEIHLNKYLYKPCWITVSPAMWVTGNMASNMSLWETKGKGKRELATHTCYYGTLSHQFSRVVCSVSYTKIQHTHKTFCGGAALWERQQPSSRCKLHQRAKNAKRDEHGNSG